MSPKKSMNSNNKNYKSFLMSKKIMISYQFKLVFIVFIILCCECHSAQLVGIAELLGDPPFGLVHRLLSFSFSDTPTAPFHRRLDLFPLDLIHRNIGRGRLFFLLSATLFLFCSITSMLCLSIQILET
ncbi:hypothetical protein H5410_031980 [Solanum commersonii]|uniref:Uncharacterized protein n=1 Tax=Solanum commersonii TaxID=4109 RepID=A0A9J5YJR9_SOLCO|nr:hypothetical protein H5410_031980 [Solanum commersonii]